MEGKIKYNFSAKVWHYPAPNGWHFVSLPITISQEIREQLRWQEEGWGRMKATAEIGNTKWETSIWFDKKHNTYILPLKSEIRKKEALENDKEINLIVWI